MVLVLKLISIAMARQDYVCSKRKKQVCGGGRGARVCTRASPYESRWQQPSQDIHVQAPCSFIHGSDTLLGL